MFEYEEQSRDCRYFPHASLLGKELSEILQPLDNIHEDVRNELQYHFKHLPFQKPTNIFFVECMETGVNIAKGSDLITNNLFNDWTGDKDQQRKH